MIEDKLTTLKKEYIKIKNPNQAGWTQLESQLGSQNYFNALPIVKSGAILASVFILTLTLLISSAKAAKPTSSLYPLKLLTQDIQSKITGKYENKIENIAQDIVKFQDSSLDLQKAIETYQKTLDKTKEQAEQKDNQQEFKQILDSQENKFRREIERSSQNRQKLQEVINQIEQIKGDVNGERDQRLNREDHQDEGNNND